MPIISQIEFVLKKNTSTDMLLTLILNARLNPLAKKPPNGPIIDENSDMAMECRING